MTRAAFPETAGRVSRQRTDTKRGAARAPLVVSISLARAVRVERESYLAPLASGAACCSLAFFAAW